MHFPHCSPQSRFVNTQTNMDFKFFIFTLALCFAVTMATITFEDDLWNEDGLFGDMEETKRGENPVAAPGMPLFADVMDIMKRRIIQGEQNYT